jgi:hypothetical protein
MRNIRPRLFAPWLVLSLSALLALGAVGCRNPALANESEDECSIANVAGTYGFVGFGQLLPTNAFNLPPGPESNVGRFALDGRGSFVLVETVRVSVGGTDQFINPRESGTYTVDAGCNFTLTGSIPPFIPKPIKLQIGVFVNHRKELRAMGTVPGLFQNYVSTTRV